MSTERASGPTAALITDPPPTTRLDEQIARVGTTDVAVAFLTYNNAETLPEIVAAVARGAGGLRDAAVALVDMDAGSSDGTPGIVAGAGLPAVLATYDAP